MDSDPTADVVILGAGPAGAAAAIHCAQSGLSTVLVDRKASQTGLLPGETLPPGIEPLMDQLGVGEAFRDADFLRFPGHYVSWRGPVSFEPFGEDGSGQWFGFQVPPTRLRTTLLARAIELGVELPNERIIKPLLSAGAVAGVETEGGPLFARYVIDASGSQRILRRALKLKATRHTRPLMAWYAYHQRDPDCQEPAPHLRADASGWTWVAPVSSHTTQWVRLDFSERKFDRGWCPEAVRGCAVVQATRRQDVTWRETVSMAGPGFFIVGDAAATLDPLCGHGTLRAIMSGMMAAHAVGRVLQDGFDAGRAAREFSDWFRGWYAHDRQVLSQFYAQHPAWDFECA